MPLLRIKGVTCSQKSKVVALSLPDPSKHGVVCPFKCRWRGENFINALKCAQI